MKTLFHSLSSERRHCERYELAEGRSGDFSTLISVCARSVCARAAVSVRLLRVADEAEPPPEAQVPLAHCVAAILATFKIES